MKIWKLDLPFAAAALALAVAPGAWAQGRLFNKVVVDFPNDIHVNDQVLPKGHYELRQLRADGAASSVMLIMSEGASHFDMDAITIPAVNNNTPNKTLVVLQRLGSDYYLDKVWVAGQDYGYEFPIPSDVKSRLNEQLAPVTLSANYQAAPAPEAAANAAPAAAPAPEQEALARQQQEAAQQLKQSAQELQQAAQQQREAAEQAQQAAQQARDAAQQQQQAAQQQREAAQQAQQAAQAAQEAQNRQPAPAPEVAQNTPPPQPNENQSNQPNRIPQTASGWANYLALGILAAGLAALLRRRRRASLP
jgi:LPXTG-motif cell wall-anchored protein